MGVTLGVLLALLVWLFLPGAPELGAVPTSAARRSHNASGGRKAPSPPASERVGASPPSASQAEEQPEGGYGILIAHVYDDLGRPSPDAWVTSRECHLDPAPPQGGLTYHVPKGQCAVWAARHDGQLVTRGEPQLIDIQSGAPTTVTLQLPSERRGGMQLALAREDDGMRVRWAPAPEEDGLEVGDLIIAIDGVAVRDLSTEDVLNLLVGAEGSEVEIELGEVDTGDQIVTITRRLVE